MKEKLVLVEYLWLRPLMMSSDVASMTTWCWNKPLWLSLDLLTCWNQNMMNQFWLQSLRREVKMQKNGGSVPSIWVSVPIWKQLWCDGAAAWDQVRASRLWKSPGVPERNTPERWLSSSQFWFRTGGDQNWAQIYKTVPVFHICGEEYLKVREHASS